MKLFFIIFLFVVFNTLSANENSIEVSLNLGVTSGTGLGGH